MSYDDIGLVHNPQGDELPRKRAQSLKGFNKTERNDNAVKSGLTSFIVKSGIDLDELSNNLSQKQDSQNSQVYKRSKSNQSKNRGRGGRANGPGLPLPRNPSQSRAMAEMYRKKSQERKSNLNKILPPQELQVAPKMYSEPPNITDDLNQNEQTFENFQKYIKAEQVEQSPPKDPNSMSPNFYDPNAFRKTPERLNKSNDSNKNRTLHDSGASPIKQQPQTSYSHEMGMSDEKKVPVGSIVKIPAQVIRSSQDYQSFGHILKNKDSQKPGDVKSYSPNRSTFATKYSPMIEQQNRLATRNPGFIVRQNSRGASSNSMNRTSTIKRDQPLARTEQFQLINMKYSEGHQTLNFLDQSQSILTMLADQNRLKTLEPQSELLWSVQIPPQSQFIDLLPPIVWDLFQDSVIKDTQKVLSDPSLLELYTSVRNDISESQQAILPNLIQSYKNSQHQQSLFQELFTQSQQTLRKIVRASKILYKERLAHMVSELSQLKLKLNERQKQHRAALIENLREKSLLQSKGQNQKDFSFQANGKQLKQVNSLKQDILKDICCRLRQKIVIYAIQLKIYEKEEVHIIFDEMWQGGYKQILQRFYFNQVKQAVAINRRKREIQSYVKEVVRKSKVRKIWEALKEARAVRIFYQQRFEAIQMSLQSRKLKVIFSNWRLYLLGQKLEKVDMRVVKKYRQYKYCHQLFFHWVKAHQQLVLTKQMALNHIRGEEEVEPSCFKQISDKDMRHKMEKCQQSMYNVKYEQVQSVRVNLIKKINILQRNAPFLNSNTFQQNSLGMTLHSERSNLTSVALNMPLQINRGSMASSAQNQQNVFSSLIRNQNPDGYLPETEEKALDMKKDIHSLLVDTQNYFKQDQERGRRQQSPTQTRGSDLLGARRFPPRPESAGGFIRNNSQPMKRPSITRNLPLRSNSRSFMLLQDQKLMNTEDTGYKKPPNQLFAMLEKKQIKAQQNSQKAGLSQFRSFQAPFQGPRQHQKVESKLNLMKRELLEKIKEVLDKLRILKNENTYEKHYSLALNYIIKQEHEARRRYSRGEQINQNDGLRGPYIDTNMNSERDFNNQNLTEEEYTETYPVTMASGARGSPSRDSYDQSQFVQQQHQYQQDGESNFYIDDTNMDNFQQENHVQPVNSQFIHLRNNTTSTNIHFGQHAPSFSVISKVSKFSINKDKYTLEDYVQFAQAQKQLALQFQNQDGSLPKLTSEMFQRLHNAKMASVLIGLWKVKYLEKYLGQYMHELRALNILQQTFVGWARLGNQMQARASQFYESFQLQKFYQLFIDWTLINRHIVVDEKKIVKRFRQKMVLGRWMRFMNFQGDYLLMILKARKYHHQALTSKALLSLYTYTIKQRKVLAFSRRIAFKKFFKRAWVPQYEKSKALRLVMGKITKKHNDWERTRYQREFNYLYKAFEAWIEHVQAQRDHEKHYCALSFYRQTLMVRYFGKLKYMVRVNYGVRILESQVCRVSYAPAIDHIKDYCNKLEFRQRDWDAYRADYIRSQVFIRWREHTVKQKLAKMFFKKSILQKFKQYVFEKNHDIPFQFWKRYRQILFFKILRYHAHKQQKKQRKISSLNKKMEGYRLKLMKKSFVGLLENIYSNKRQAMIDHTVEQFRNHKLSENTFQLLKIAYLNSKKKKILMRVAEDFRQERIQSDMVFVNPIFGPTGGGKDHYPVREHHHQELLKKVYTAWLQQTLEGFIKKKVLKRFQIYQGQKTLMRVFKAWSNLIQRQDRYDEQQVIMSESPGFLPGERQIYGVNDFTANEEAQENRFTPCRVGFPDLQGSLGSDFVKIEATDRQELAETQDLGLTQASGLYVESGPTTFKTSIAGDRANVLIRQSQATAQQLRQSLENTQSYMQTSEKQQQRKAELSPMTDLQNPYELTPAGKEDQAHAVAGQLDSNNQRLFSELEAIFDRNRQWMDQQRDNEKIIQNLADQYEERILLQSQHSRSNFKSDIGRSGRKDQRASADYSDVSIAEGIRGVQERQARRENASSSNFGVTESDPRSYGRNYDGESYVNTCLNSEQTPISLKQQIDRTKQIQQYYNANQNSYQPLRDYRINSPEFKESYLNASEDEMLSSTVKEEFQRNKTYGQVDLLKSNDLEDSSLMLPKQVFSQGTDLIYSGQTEEQPITKSQITQSNFIEESQQSGATDEQIRALVRNHRNNGSMRLQSSFSDLAKELKNN